MTVPAQCQNGSVWWNYPRGTLQVTFNNARAFTVCLTPTLGPVLGGIAQLVQGRELRVASPPGQAVLRRANNVRIMCVDL